MRISRCPVWVSVGPTDSEITLAVVYQHLLRIRLVAQERVSRHGVEQDPSRERALLRQRMDVLDGEEQKIQRGKKR
jgi:hypothetical protein